MSHWCNLNSFVQQTPLTQEQLIADTEAMARVRFPWSARDTERRIQRNLAIRDRRCAARRVRAAAMIRRDRRRAARRVRAAAVINPVASSTPTPQAAAQARQLRCWHCVTSKNYKEQYALTLHIRDRHVGRVCHWPQCGTTTNSEEELLAHFSQHQKDAIAGGLESVVCPWPNCAKRLSRRDSVQRCIKRHNRAAARPST